MNIYIYIYTYKSIYENIYIQRTLYITYIYWSVLDHNILQKINVFILNIFVISLKNSYCDSLVTLRVNRMNLDLIRFGQLCRIVRNYSTVYSYCTVITVQCTLRRIACKRPLPPFSYTVGRDMLAIGLQAMSLKQIILERV